MMSLSKRLRYEILRRDNYTCRYCGATAPEVKLTVDHVHPTSLGGGDEPSNLVAACRDCNAGKTSSSPDAPLVENIANDALRWAEAIKAVAESRNSNRGIVDTIILNVDRVWKTWSYESDDGTRVEIPRPSDWPDTIDHMFSLGLGFREMEHLVGVAMRSTKVPASDTWRYFAGCCWRELDAIQDEAKQAMDVAEQIRKGWQ